MKRRNILAFILTMLLVFSMIGCAKSDKPNLLICYAGTQADEFGGEVYAACAEGMSGAYDCTLLELGSSADSYEETFSSALAGDVYDKIVIVGKEAYSGLSSYIKKNKGKSFIALDCRLTEIPSNVAAVEFSPEQFGYLGARVSAASEGKPIGYISLSSGTFENRILYGFLQGTEEEVFVKFIEERSNVLKAMDYADQIYESGAEALFDHSGRNSLGTLESAYRQGKPVFYGGVNLRTAASKSKSEEMLASIGGGVEKDYERAFSLVCDASVQYASGESAELTAEQGVFRTTIDSAAQVKKLSENEDDFLQQYAERVSQLDNRYTPQYTVEANYHEAVPSCADTNDWKYKPRAGSNNGIKPADWKSVGVWATIYLQEGCEPVSNTGIEFQDMRIWAYTESIGWKLLEHANPVGSFYDENFTDDSHNTFMSNYINYASEKRTRIKLDYATVGYNYHPFGSQIDLVASGFLNSDGSVKNGDTLYIFSEMSIRLCVWDQAVEQDIDDAKYVANIGADWWREVGLQWTPDWNSNKDVCVGQFRTITKDWKKLYMTNVPSEKYDEIFADFTFE